ncbi:hypothetical protein [Streptomyces spinosirectus]
MLGRELATARAGRATDVVALVLEHLAYAELREGSHRQARVHAEAGLEAVGDGGQRNVAAGGSPYSPWPPRSRGTPPRSPRTRRLRCSSRTPTD